MNPLSTTARARTRRGWPIGAYLCAAIILLFFLFPILYLINSGLKSPAEFTRNPIGLVQHPELGNFAEAWQKGHFAAYLLNTVLYTFFGATGATILSMLLGFPLARGYIGGLRLWNGMLAALLFLPNALVAQFQLLLALGLYNTRVGYIIMCAVGVGVGPLLFRGYAQSIPKELDEAAAVDGASYWRYLWTFVFPLARPALVTIFILNCVWMWNEVILGTVLFASQAKWPIATGLNAFKGLYSTNWPLLAAATMIVAIPLIVVYVFIQKYLVNGVVGAVKG